MSVHLRLLFTAVINPLNYVTVIAWYAKYLITTGFIKTSVERCVADFR